MYHRCGKIRVSNYSLVQFLQAQGRESVPYIHDPPVDPPAILIMNRLWEVPMVQRHPWCNSCTTKSLVRFTKQFTKFTGTPGPLRASHSSQYTKLRNINHTAYRNSNHVEYLSSRGHRLGCCSMLFLPR